MDTKSLILVLMIVYILTQLDFGSSSAPKAEGFQAARAPTNPDYRVPRLDHCGGADRHLNGGRPRRARVPTNDYFQSLVSDFEEWEEPAKMGGSRVLPHLLTTQFHQDYQDVLNGLNLIVPTGQTFFNVASLPLEYSEPNPQEAEALVSEFLRQLNQIINTEVSLQVHGESGWEKVQTDLGVPQLYERPAGIRNLGLVEIQKVKKYQTQHESKYACQVVIQKEGVADQMLLSISFVTDTRERDNEDELFWGEERQSTPVIRIEQIFVGGFYSATPGSYQDSQEVPDLFPFEETEGQQMTDPDYIQKELLKKYLTRTRELQCRNAMLDEEGRVFQQHLTEKIHTYPAYQATTTIFDEFNSPERNFS